MTWSGAPAARGGQAAQDLELLVRINVDRMLHMSRHHGHGLIGTTCFLATVLGLLGFVYDVEFAQAVMFIFVPLMILGYLSLRACLRIEAGENEGEALYRRLFRQRLATQFLGMTSIFVTSLYGMWVNLLLLVPG